MNSILGSPETENKNNLTRLYLQLSLIIPVWLLPHQSQ